MAPEFRRKLDYSDIQAAPEDGKRYELVEGELFVNPAPSPIHQRISRRLQRPLEDYFHERSACEVFDAPIDLILTHQDVFGPDILVTADSSQITKRGIEAPPVLVDEKRIECFHLDNGAFRAVIDAQGDTTLTHPAWDGLVVDLAALWR